MSPLIKYGIEDLAEYNKKKQDSNELVFYLEWNGILLNISYIYPNFALMCTPSATEVHKRNDIRIVSDFIHEKHGRHFYIFNVHEQSYDTKYFEDKVIYLPFPDHCSPRISYFDQACEALSKIFKDDPQCTVFVHCKAGRGRSGTVICAYQIYSRAVKKVKEAIDMVDLKRSPKKISITIPSQLRFLRYYEYKCLNGPLKQQRIKITKIEFTPEFNRNMNYSFTLGIPFEDKEMFRKEFDGHIIDEPLEFQNEVAFFIYEINSKNSIVRLQLHSDYLIDSLENITETDNGFLAYFSKMELDGPHNRKTSKNFPDDFSMNLYFQYI
ncbi:hypothetical protein TRFO_35757 [Tritrichomonas foetus]|uniref:Uncharacterized protein n=1 Tax=Tritrichomonas foetus TaxID=1144522 RepID=A0A1J4JGV7_9EUKA|nr:hypothetical protein TRFO_35757 [Tritrichomonas foetus]|eukprot:OHS97921.1 hypothetical protein TRFO_35757 [Tritrichomonas foetus]